jgi:hypothetical protein
MDEDIPMYCCLPFSYAIKYALIKVDYEHNAIEISLKSSLSEGEKRELSNRLSKAHIMHIHPDYFYIIHCPWCGVHMRHVIDFDKCVHAGQYSSKEGWER